MIKVVGYKRHLKVIEDMGERRSMKNENKKRGKKNPYQYVGPFLVI